MKAQGKLAQLSILPSPPHRRMPGVDVLPGVSEESPASEFSLKNSPALHTQSLCLGSAARAGVEGASTAGWQERPHQ